MDLPALRTLSEKDLRAELEKQRREAFALKQGLRAGEVKGHHLFRAARKAVAQILSLLHEKSPSNAQSTPAAAA